MKTITSVKVMQALCQRLRRNQSIGFVPTMGFLHAGHLELVKTARKNSDIVLVSIFVNPTQFGKNEDLNCYPRDEKSDLAKLKKLGVDLVFLPRAEDIYPTGFQTTVSVTEITKNLCGKSRPTHFDGVATVVLKLFNIVTPHVAVFGKKDFQQFCVIKRLVTDLNLPIRILGVGTVRESDGLALSSRNVYLTPADRKLALGLSQGLMAVKEACRARPQSAEDLRAIFLNVLGSSSRLRVDYFACCHAETLAPLVSSVKSKTLVAVAVFVGNTRLIDNIIF